MPQTTPNGRPDDEAEGGDGAGTRPRGAARGCGAARGLPRELVTLGQPHWRGARRTLSREARLARRPAALEPTIGRQPAARSQPASSVRQKLARLRARERVSACVQVRLIWVRTQENPFNLLMTG